MDGSKLVGFISFSKTGSHSKEIDEIFKLRKRLKEQKKLEDFDKMSKCKNDTKHLYIRVAKINSNRKLVKNMAKTMKTKNKETDDESKIVSDTDAWITVSENAVFVNIPVEVAEKIPISEYTNSDGVTLKRLTMVGSKKILENLIEGKKKGVPLGYFKE